MVYSQTRCSCQVNSSENVSGNGKVVAKMRGRRKWAADYTSESPLLEISFNNNNLKVQRQVFFSTDNCYLRWFRTLLDRQTENKDWHATKGPCRDWIRDVVATEHMSRPREHQLASLNFCYLALFSVRTVPSFLCMLLLSCTFFIIQIFDIKGVSLHMDGVVWEDSIAT